MGRCELLFPVFWRYPADHVYNQHYRRLKPSVSESHENEERISKRQFAGKNAVSGKWECHKEMDAEIPKLGSGAEPADCPVWRTAYQLSIRKKQEWCRSNASHSRSLSIPSVFVLLPGFSHSIPEVGCGQRPQKGNMSNALFVM